MWVSPERGARQTGDLRCSRGAALQPLPSSGRFSCVSHQTGSRALPDRRAHLLAETIPEQRVLAPLASDPGSLCACGVGESPPPRE